MKKTVSLKENHEFRRLYHRGVSTAGKHVVIYCRRNKLGYNRLGLTVSAKLACAVKRNRIKRLFREAYRLNEDKFADGIDLVLVARVRAVGASYQEIEKSLLRALKDNKVAAAGISRPARSMRSRPSRNTVHSRAAGWRLSASAAAILSLREDPMTRFLNSSETTLSDEEDIPRQTRICPGRKSARRSAAHRFSFLYKFRGTCPRNFRLFV